MTTQIIVIVIAILLVGATLWSSLSDSFGAPVPFGRSAFDQMSRLLIEQGVTITRSDYNSQAFGSWLIEVAASPPMRIVWDGKESCLSVQRQTNEIHPHFGWHIYEAIIETYSPTDEADALRRAADEVRRVTAV